MTAPIDFHTTWRKSTFSGAEANCVEVAFGTWRKSSASGAQTNCVEVAFAEQVVGVRDSKNQEPLLSVGRDSWGRLVDRLQRS